MTTYLRADWGSVTAISPTTPIAGPLADVFIHHTVTGTPTTVEAAMSTVRGVQRYHIESSGFSDIGYSWLVDQLGNIYEGRGWGRAGAHTYGRNLTSHAVAWLGDSTKVTPTTSAVAAIAQCIVAGQTAGAITMTPAIGGHRDANADTACPGDGLYHLLPIIRAAVLDLPPATIDPPEDELTEEQARQLAEAHAWSRESHFWLAQGYIPGGVVAAMRPDIDALAGKIDAIAGTVPPDLSKIPTAALVAELGRRASA